MDNLVVSCRGFEKTETIDAEVGRHAEKLFGAGSRATRVDVTIDLRHRNHRQGNVFHVQIRIQLPRGDIFVNRETEKNRAHESLPVAIRDAFLTARRRLEDEARIRREEMRREKAPA